jgi:chemotaxis protein methyltransferase CheR
MLQDLPAPLLSQLSEFVAGHMGLYFPPERWRDLERGIRSAARESGAASAEAYAEWLLSAPLAKAQIEALASEMTVGETYFFRENRSFEILGERILPELIRARQGREQRLRVWSAGCCSGEEAYSIAILLDRILPARRDWHVTILATDINPRFLQKAAAGIYSEWSFRNPPAWLKGHYFHPAGEHKYAILPRIKEMVTFAYLNLAEDTFPSLSNNTNAMDLIFCRNVLMYFAPDRMRKVIGNFHRSLVEGGNLIVSSTETSAQLFSPFTPAHFEGATFYGKNTGRAPAPAFPFSWETSVPKEEAVSPAPPAPPVYFSIPETPPVVPAPLPPESAATGPTPYQEALALFEQGNYLDAAQKLKMDSGEEPEVGSLALMARICANLGQLAEAQTWAEKAIGADKLNAGLHYLRAIILQEQDALEESTASLRRALYLDPGFILSHYALGNLALRQHRFEESTRHFTNALALLKRCPADDILPLSDGLAAGRLGEMIQSAISMEATA